MSTDAPQSEEHPVHLKDLLFEYDLLGVYQDPEARPMDDDEYDDLIWPVYGWLEEGASPQVLSERFAEILRDRYGLENATPEGELPFMQKVHTWWQDHESEGL